MIEKVLFGEFLIIGLFWAAFKFRKQVIEAFFNTIQSSVGKRYGLSNVYNAGKSGLDTIKSIASIFGAFEAGRIYDDYEESKNNKDKTGSSTGNTNKLDDMTKDVKTKPNGDVVFPTENGDEIDSQAMPSTNEMLHVKDSNGNLIPVINKDGKNIRFTNPIVRKLENGELQSYIKMADGKLAKINDISYRMKDGKLTPVVNAVDPDTNQPIDVPNIPLLEYRTNAQGEAEQFIHLEDGQEVPVSFREENGEYIPFVRLNEQGKITTHDIQLPYSIVKTNNGLGCKIKKDGKLYDVHFEKRGNDIIPYIEEYNNGTLNKIPVNLPHNFMEAGEMEKNVYYYEKEGNKIPIHDDDLKNNNNIFEISGKKYYKDNDTTYELKSEKQNFKILNMFKKTNDGKNVNIKLPENQKFML